MPVINPPPYSPHSDIEQKLRQENEHPRHIPESEGNNKRTLLIGVSAIVIVLLAIGALFYGIFA